MIVAKIRQATKKFNNELDNGQLKWTVYAIVKIDNNLYFTISNDGGVRLITYAPFIQLNGNNHKKVIERVSDDDLNHLLHSRYYKKFFESVSAKLEWNII